MPPTEPPTPCDASTNPAWLSLSGSVGLRLIEVVSKPARHVLEAPPREALLRVRLRCGAQLEFADEMGALLAT